MEANNSPRRIFLSSTAEDLREYRQAVMNALLMSDFLPVAVEVFRATLAAPLDVIQNEIKECDALVVIVGHRYGWIPSEMDGGDGQKSITWLEVEKALSINKPVFAFIVDPKFVWTHAKEQDVLVNSRSDNEILEISRNVKSLQEFKMFLSTEAHLTRDTFTTPENLVIKVVASLTNWYVYEKTQSIKKEKKNVLSVNVTPEIKSRLISDTPNILEEDVLGYDLLADNLFNILVDDATKPPLNIGIMAPWGRGKTTLMKRLQNKFDNQRKLLLEQITVSNSANKTPPKVNTINKWLKSDNIKISYNLPFATVWFNPWNYQSSNMIWAGLANAVIEQVVEQIPVKTDREFFWLQLNISRIDKAQLRRDLHTRFILYISQFFIWGLVISFSLLFFLLNNNLFAVGFLGLGSFMGAIATIGSKIKSTGEKVSEVFDKYSKEPLYNKNLGDFHEVQKDLNTVLDLCVDPEKPIVIFVDDLDRCSPSKVVEVIEAINVFINGPYNNRCYFILGMDAEMVAAALDVSYEKMKGKIGSRESEQGTVGWYFLDKFIQLPFFIPVMSEQKKQEYLEMLLSDNTENKENIEIDFEKVKNAFNSAIDITDSKESKRTIESYNLSIYEKNEVNKMFLKHQITSNEQNEKVKNEVAKYSHHLSSDPRSLKRFANMLRFYSSYQFMRMKMDLNYATVDSLSKWIVLMLKFPQMVRWIQWDAENKTGINANAESKSKFIDEMLFNFLDNNKTYEEDKAYKTWKEHQSSWKTNEDVGLNINDIPCMQSMNLYRVLIFQAKDDSKFINALNCNVW